MSAAKSTRQAEVEERRKSERLAVSEPGALTATAGGQIYTCFIEDVSPEGLRLRFVGAMPRGNVIAIEHPMAGTICGRCAWRKGDTMGMELQSPASDLERILKCICLVL